MERMLKRIAIRKDGTISMSEFRNFAEKYQGEIDRLEEENKKLKLIQETNEKQIQNDIKERDELREENKKLREENKKLQNDLETVASAYFDR